MIYTVIQSTQKLKIKTRTTNKLKKKSVGYKFTEKFLILNLLGLNKYIQELKLDFILH